MKIYIVSCNPGRVERLFNASKSLNLDFEVVNSPLSTDEEVQQRGKKAFETEKAYPGGLAATLGHLKAMRKFVDSEKELSIIIEDDVRFHNDWNKYILIIEEYFKKSEMNVMTIGFLSKTTDKNLYNNTIQPLNIGENLEVYENVGVSNPWGCQCYMIKREFALKFLDLFEDKEITDSYSGDFVTDIVIYDPVIGCRRSTLLKPIAIECPYEQSIVGSNNKPPIQSLVNPYEFKI